MKKNTLVQRSLIFILTPLLICNAQMKGEEENAFVENSLHSAHVKSQILNTSLFHKSDTMDERVMLLINSRLYWALQKEINQYIQDMFNEGIDVWPFLIDSEQFLLVPNQWNAEAGLQLKEFVKKAYNYIKMYEIADRTKKGLIILGTFPAAFINWHQVRYVKSESIGWADLRATNDYQNGIINLKWTAHPAPGRSDYDISIYECSDPEKQKQTRKVLDLPFQPGYKNHRLTDTQYMLDFKGQRHLQFGINAVYRDNSTSDTSYSNVVNWNFLINPCDYVLADIDGFSTPVNRIMDYALHDNRNYGVMTYPLLVVTNGVDSNSQAFELSPADSISGRSYAQSEMYFGRIDASSITGGWKSPSVSNSLKNSRFIDRFQDESHYWEEEVRLIRNYLRRNHLWRRSIGFRESFDSTYIFRSSDFVGEANEKNRVKAIWGGQGQMVLQDAKGATGCNRKRIPDVTLYSQVGLAGDSLILENTSQYNDLKNQNFDDIARSISLNPPVTQGAVEVFEDKDYQGRSEIFQNSVNDLDTTSIGENCISSVKFWSNFEMNSPSWDTRDSLFMNLKKKWKLVDLGVHGYQQGFELCNAPDRGGERRVYQRDIWRLGGDIKFLINHCCHNGEFMALGNAGTTFLFMNKMLAEWCWSGSGTIEHEVLHRRLKAGDRFGVAVMKNLDDQMQGPGGNPWRSYFSMVLGDPTLRIQYPSLQLNDHAVQVNERDKRHDPNKWVPPDDIVDPVKDPTRVPRPKSNFWSVRIGGLLSKTEKPLFSANEPATQNQDKERQYALTWTGGLFFDHFVSSSISVESGVVYSEKYAKFQSFNQFNKYDQTRFRMLTLPVIFKYNFGEKSMRPFAGAGIELSYLLAIKHGYYNNEGEKIYLETVGTSERKLVKCVRSPFLYSAGMTIGCRIKRVTIGLHYTQSMNEIELSPVPGFSDGKVSAGKMTSFMILFGLSL